MPLLEPFPLLADPGHEVADKYGFEVDNHAEEVLAALAWVGSGAPYRWRNRG